MENHTNLYDVGVIGLGVMGKNLSLNIADNQYRVVAFDLDAKKVEGVVQQEKADRISSKQLHVPLRVSGCNNLSEMLSSLEKPRIIVLSVPAGAPVDGVCNTLIDAGIAQDDIVIDTGNSLWTDTVEREARYADKFIFFSSAVSGGEMGARFGPSLMPSGNIKAWNRIKPIWEAIAAKVNPETGLPIERQEPGNPVTEGEPCTTYIGPAGAGHYVKMVHNGIEYADMQLICEAYQLLSDGFNMSADEIANLFERWNRGSLNSYLMEISAEVLKQADPISGKPLVEMILDKAGQKGTGLWTAVSSLQIGCPAPTIAEAVYARAVSTQKDQRVKLSQLLTGPVAVKPSDEERDAFITQLESALYCAKVASYAQGFQLMAMNAKERNWTLDFAEIAKIWRAGCIIRATFLQSITQAYQAAATTGIELENLLMADVFSQALSAKQLDWRQAVSTAVLKGIPAPCISSALAYYDSYRSETLPANLLQGQRDYFGAHTFERTDKPAGEKYHLNWSSAKRELDRV
ncbi:NADP-dependent phosphogluconate dehydrogenase [Shewanella sp. D64]|uniref:NADP-dependent phosphogluconate dehydrogenase n=1 Tax=unclassified Shewanella TaxID=196818 RepID=UPI0022BA52BD|nr:MULTISPECIES: NADP-dependent phosphogluconate dehydrogenase [unclassified Shewanella]MEC4726913.1 NADP-dependent phosphogluconate dehydrogenase [Shewanella sp. D64]MEC4738590.1 NADP-dependent phosphogluconate dehydrogenase [Shewanella sp. E94]WBJ93808.1 NADP-dependent phosphogluconate dehydrogenase [Shewanella sp. MTB7]